jgi:hypothetical protein
MNNEEKYTLYIYQQLSSMFNDKECENYIENHKDIDLSLFFHSITAAGTMLFNQITGNKKNILEFNQIQNTLAFKYGEIE